MATRRTQALALVLGLAAGTACAAPLVTPGGTIDVGGFELTGSALAVAAFTEHVTVYSQSRVSALYSPSGTAYPDVGLDRSFELTALIGFGETQGVGPGGDLLFALDPASPVNYFRLYLDAAPNADSLHGTGFDDGRLILAGRLTALGSVFAFGSGIEPLDQHFQNDYPGVQSTVAAGVDTITVAVDMVDAAAWPEGVANVFQGIAPSRFPFTLVDPSRQYQTPSGVQLPDIGLVNGMDGPDLVLETRATISLVSEPTSLALVIASMAGLLAAAGRRTTTLRERR